MVFLVIYVSVSPKNCELLLKKL
ncbi:hypothetical protein C5167_007869 [Papaver somniferum]|nr:hypothetical protein C5167_007869 [Papaver somniferum]